ncbi:uncharacterized protein GJ701_006702 isoform 2-T6 [Geothlypis trichas]
MKGRAARGAAEAQQPRPCDRYKHACAVCRGFVYLHGGHGSTTLRDFWRYHTVKNEWEMLDCSRDGPEELEEHSMVAYKGSLYIFGGMVDSASTQAKTPLWIYDIDSARWTESCNEPAETETQGSGCLSAAPVTAAVLERGMATQQWFITQPCTSLGGCWGSLNRGTFGGGTLEAAAGPASEQGIGVDFQTTSDFTDAFPSHCKSVQKDHPQLVPILRHSGFCSFFCPQPTERSNAIEMKTFSLPLEPAAFPASQTTSETGLGPKRDRSCLSKDKSLPLLACSGEAFAAAQAVDKEERPDWGCVATGGGISRTNTLLLIGGKPLSSFSGISFRQMEFDCL